MVKIADGYGGDIVIFGDTEKGKQAHLHIGKHHTKKEKGGGSKDELCEMSLSYGASVPEAGNGFSVTH